MNSSTKLGSYSIEVTTEAVQDWLVAALAKQLNVRAEDIDINSRLDSYGLDSAQALCLIGGAEKLLGIKISPMLLWHYPTIKLLSERIVEELEEDESEIFEF